MENFLSLLNDSAPGFICRAAGRQEPKPPPFIVQVTHKLGTPTDSSGLSALIDLRAEPLISFWSRHDGADFFIGPFMRPIGMAPAVRFYGCSEIQSKTDDMRQAAVGDEEGAYDFQREGVAFGEICFSGNYFVISKGAVFYSNHDGGDDSPFASSFALFLDRFAENPAKFLFEAGCYTRYADGTTRNQWIPETYLPNVASV